MKLTKYLSLVSFLFIVQFILFNSGCRLGMSMQSASADDSWKHFYAVSWVGTVTDNVKYAKQMGYDYIAPVIGISKNQYNKNSACAGLKFYLTDPHLEVVKYLGYSNPINKNTTYTQAKIDWYNQNMAWKSNDAFPNNLATGWWGGSTSFSVRWDFQQQRVIDLVVEGIVDMIHAWENTSLPFTYAGYIIDVPSLTGDFNFWNGSANTRVTLAYWTGANSSLIHDNITHEYSTYSEGTAAFYKQLNERIKQEYPDAKWLIEPWVLYNSKTTAYGVHSDWIYQIKDRSDKDELTPDMLFQEGYGTEFVDNANNFNSGVNITKDRVGSTQTKYANEYQNRLVAAKAGNNGAWYSWFGKLYSPGGDMPDFQGIAAVYPRLKLVRCIPGWDNLNGVPVDASSRTWDGNVYESYKDGKLQSYISSDVMYSRHPKTGKLFAVFNTTNGVITLKTGETVTNVQKVDGYFIEAGDASADFDISGSEIRIKSSVSIEKDSSGNSKGKGYIFTVKTSGAPTATTGGATNVTSGSATLNGMVNGDGLSTTAWFEYGVVSGSYTNTSSTQSVSGSVDTAVSTGISGLSAGKTYYYRIAAQNSAGTTYGNGRSFTTPDTTGPSGSLTVNNNSSYANSTAVTLNLSATDDVGVTGYFLSNSNTAPSASSSGWTIITYATAYSADVSYSLSGGNGKKTVYAWFKDAAGNVSGAASDSITLDTTAPTVTITNPTYNSTYTATSGTINLGGDASDNASGVSSVSWNNDRGGSGSTTNGATGWFISGISLSSGDNVITVTVTDGANNTGTDTITITYGAAPSVKTGSATHLTSNSATLNETINANGISTTVWFEYGATSGMYSNTSSTQTVSGSSDTTVSISITGLSSGKTYYYRVVAQNSIGTTYGAEKSFTTLDTTAPVSSIVIDGGASYAKSSAVTLSLSATDNVGVTGYYLSASATTPSASAAGWTSVTSAASHSAGVSYTLGSGDGSKTVYVWYKDAAGNVSGAASDSITLDTAAPVITITSPTSGSTYSTASGTLNLGGSVSDATSGLAGITWSNTNGGSGAASGTSNWTISGISLSSGNNVITVIATDAVGNSSMASITVTYGAVPAATTGSATNVASDSATVEGTVNANHLSTTVWFEYGVTSGTYSNTSSTQTVSGSVNTTASISITGLSSGKTYYYRIAAQNSAGTTYGSEKSFAALDITAPACSIVINGGDAYTKSADVTLALSATDDVGVTGYYLSASDTTPTASANGWTPVDAGVSYSGNVSYSLSSGDGSKTIYVWYKDAAGNVSTSANDAIMLDTAAPSIAITSPTSNTAYSATSSTLNLDGSASDTDSGVSSVTWSSDKGGSGTASGTSNWSISDIALSTGENVITVTATDEVGNSSTASITVTFNNDAGGSLQANYKFDEGSGTTAGDSSGKGKDGTISGAAWTTGKNGNGLSFNGTSDYVSVPTMNYEEISLSAWFYKNSNDTTNADAIFGGYQWTSDEQKQEGFDLKFHQSTPNTLHFKVVTQDSNGKKTLKTNYKNLGNSVGNWYHVVGTYNKSTGAQKLYINGQLVATQTHPAGNTIVPLTFYADMRIGYSRVNNGYFDGKIDEVSLYNSALSDEEVQGLYNQ